MQHFRAPLLDEHNDLEAALTILDEWAQYQMHSIQQPGLALGIVYDGNLIWGKGYGYADLESKTPVTLDTRFRVASISKTFTATAIMQLQAAGQLLLDDPIIKYLDWFKLQMEGEPPITIRHCLTHTSGLPRDGITSIWEDDSFYTWEEVIENTKKRELRFAPLEHYAYSNLGYALLGGVILAITGQTWNEYVQQHILDPLEMKNTLTAGRGGEENLAVGYLIPDDKHNRKGIHVVDAKGYDSATGMASTINDLAKYARFHLSTENTPLLSAYALRDMHRPHAVSDRWDSGYGLGISVMRMGNHTLSGHGGGYKGYLTSFLVNREHKAGFIVLTNSLDGNPFNYAEKSVKLILPELVKLNAVKKESQPDWEHYVGRYHAEWGDVLIVIRNNELHYRPVAFPDADPIILEPTDEAHIFIGKVVGNTHQKIRFEFDAAGAVVRVWRENEYANRVK